MLHFTLTNHWFWTLLKPVVQKCKTRVLVRGTLHRGECAESVCMFFCSNWFIVLFLTNQVCAFVIDSSERASQVCQVPYAQGGEVFLGIISMRNCKSAYGQNSKLQPFQGRNCQISPRSSDRWPPKAGKHSEIFISGIDKRHSATGKRP